MILQALYDLSQREGLMEDPDFEMKPVAWLVNVSETGRVKGIVGTRSAPEKTGKRTHKPAPKAFRLPRERPVTSGDRAFLLFNKAEYAFGIDPAGERDPEKLKLRFGLFRQKVKECLEHTGDEAVRAVHVLLEDIDAGRQKISLPADCTSNDLFAFVYGPDIDTLVTDRQKVSAYWRQLRAEEEAGTNKQQCCLVTGRTCSPSDMFPPLKNVPGGTTSGVYAVSYNSMAFESYGWERNENAPISREAAEACSTALNRLLHRAYPLQSGRTLPRQNVRLSEDTTVCFWTRQESEFGSVFAGLLEGNPEEVRELYRSVWRGKLVALDDPTTFYALTLSGAQGRAIVRDWFESTVEAVAQNLNQHFADLDIVRNTKPAKGQEPLPCWALGGLLESLAPNGKREDIPPAHVASIVRSALQGAPYPLSILQRAIERQRAEIGRDTWADAARRDARAALIKAVLNRRRRSLAAPLYQEVAPAMDPNVTSQGYVLGRLLAVIERLQQEALGDVNASVIDRYFSGASASPKSVFVRLLKNARHHASKIKGQGTKYGLALRLERIVDETAERFDPKHNGFPAFLDLEQQGLFILGYHQMRHWLWLSREDRDAWQKDNPSAPRAYLWNSPDEPRKKKSEEEQS
jgi:CRISPR-associated protein Csd1